MAASHALLTPQSWLASKYRHVLLSPPYHYYTPCESRKSHLRDLCCPPLNHGRPKKSNVMKNDADSGNLRLVLFLQSTWKGIMGGNDDVEVWGCGIMENWLNGGCYYDIVVFMAMLIVIRVARINLVFSSWKMSYWVLTLGLESWGLCSERDLRSPHTVDNNGR